MNNFFKLLPGFAAALALTACSSDEPVVNPDNGGTTDGEKTYLSVNISSTGDTRSTTDGGYETSTVASEHKISNVRFYFFDKDGYYMNLDAYFANPDVTTSGSGEVEYKGKNILVLNGVKQNDQPAYMLTVANAPAEFAAESTLNDTYTKAVATSYLSGGDSGDFIMSTSSYPEQNTGDNLHHDNTYPYATKLLPGDFQLTEAAAKASTTPVEVYIERLAAKVEVKWAPTNETLTVGEGDNARTLYKLDYTLAGNPDTPSSGNNNGDNNSSDKADTDLYIEILGWGLNGTAKTSYISKNIDTAWTYSWWKAPATDHRSFWGMSPLYNKTVIGNDTPFDLNLYATGTLTKKANEYAYCLENTNIGKNFVKTANDGKNTKYVNNGRVTHVVLKTRVCNEKGEALELVRANGVLFVESEYIKYVLSRAEGMSTGKLNVYTLKSSATVGSTTVTDYEQIDETYFKTEKDATKLGGVKVSVDKTKFTGTYYYKDGDAFKQYGAEGNNTLNDAYTTLTAAVETANVQPADAERFENGLNIYYIPIEHLGALASNTSAQKDDDGYYGVVRNHHYVINVTKLSKIGHGIWNPGTGTGETITPPDPEDPEYYLSARINILAWKLVTQNVEL